jgi:hypothetical protein
VISSTVFNALTADLATGLSTCVLKDGTQTITDNIPLSTFKFTGVGDATARTQYTSFGQIQDGSLTYVSTVGGTADVITLAPSIAITAYAAGQSFEWVASGANTTNVTINVSAVGAKALTKNGTSALVAGDIPSGSLIRATYDGTQFQITKIVQGTASTYSVGTSGATLGLLNANKTDSGTNTFSGANTFSNTIGMSGAAINTAQGSDVASNSTINLDTATGNIVDVTGTTTITAVTLSQGRTRIVRFTGILTLTNGASLVLPGGGNITTAAGDYAEFVGYAAGVVRVSNLQRIGNVGTSIVPSVQFETSTGTITIPTNATKCKVTLVGGGGGGGGCPGSAAGGGGGGGGALVKYLSGLTAGNTFALTIGTGGAGGGSNANGADGVDSTLASGTETITTLTASKGLLGTTSLPGAGGTGTNGDLNITGGRGTGFANGANVAFSKGGDSGFGLGIGGTVYITSTSANGVAGKGYGAGGSGGVNFAEASPTGGAGTAGVAIFEWYV